MIKLTNKQLSVLVEALHDLYISDEDVMRIADNPNVMTSEEYYDYKMCLKYAEGVMNALGVFYVSDTAGYTERYHIFPSERIPDRFDDNGNQIEILTIDALEKRVIYNLFKDDSSYSKKYAERLEENYNKYCKDNYGEDI